MVEHRLAKARAASSNLVSRLIKTLANLMFARVFDFIISAQFVTFCPLELPKIIDVAVKIAVKLLSILLRQSRRLLNIC